MPLLGVMQKCSKMADTKGKKVAQVRPAPHECPEALAHTTLVRTGTVLRYLATSLHYTPLRKKWEVAFCKNLCLIVTHAGDYIDCG